MAGWVVECQWSADREQPGSNLGPLQVWARPDPCRPVLRVTVDAPDPAAALRTAVDLQRTAVGSMGLPGYELVRATVAALRPPERSSQRLPPACERPSHVIRTSGVPVHGGAPTLLRGGRGRAQAERPGSIGDGLPLDISLGTGPLFATAEHVSTCRLLLDEVLPGLVESARHLSALRPGPVPRP